MADDTSDTNGSAGHSPESDGTVTYGEDVERPEWLGEPRGRRAPDNAVTPDTLNRRQRERERRAKLIAEGDAKRAREDLVLALVAGGNSVRDVAARTGISKSQVQRLKDSGLDRVRAEGSHEFREMLLFRHETLHKSWWAKALTGDDVAARLCLSVSQEEAKLLGVYLPVQVDVQADVRFRRQIGEQSIMRTLAETEADRIMAAQAERRLGAIDVRSSPALTNGHSNGSGV